MRQFRSRDGEVFAQQFSEPALAITEPAAHARHERDLDAAGKNGFEEQFGEIADEEDVGIGRRLLEGFEKCIGGIFHEPVGVEDDHDLATSSERTHLE